MKYRMFIVTLQNGEQVEIKTPSRITESYCRINAWHYVRRKIKADVSPEDITDVKGIS